MWLNIWKSSGTIVVYDTAYNKIYRKLIKSEQINKLKHKMQEAGSNGKLKWKVIKEGLLLEQSSTKIEEISLNGFIYKDDQD